jgi:carboxypeptidase C (cathepsin A)
VISGKLNVSAHIWLIFVLIGWICLTQIPAAMSATENEARAQAKPVSEPSALDISNRSITEHSLKTSGIRFNYTATAASITVHDKQSNPLGQIFYTAYIVEQQNQNPRPLTFVFNGGPGAASAYLHLGALGPRRVVFNADGTVPPMPPKIVDNPKSWLAFTDLVFVDPVGTGYSRVIKHGNGSNKNNEGKKPVSTRKKSSQAQAWGVVEDTESLARFIRNYLTKENRWLSPVYLVGESYGGFRVARLSKRLQSNFGIAPHGLLLISPVLDFSFLRGDKRSLWPWVALLPSYAAVAAIHGRSNEITYQVNDPHVSLASVEQTAISEYLTGLAAGVFLPDWLDQTSRLIGLDKNTLLRWNGRIPPTRFVKALLADQHHLVSLYDGSITLIDADPAKQFLTGSDSYLDRLNVSVTTAFNSYIRDHLNFKTDLPYLLLNHDVAKSWNWRSGIHGQQGFVEATTALKQALSINPDMKTLVLHGVFDLVTPYYASEIVIKQMALDSRIRNNIQLKTYHGGHMPYLHQDTLEAIFEDIVRFYELARSRSRSNQ